MAEAGPPKAETDWGTIWVFSGPEINFEGTINPCEAARARTDYNSTQQRFETGLDVARQVTAIRVHKPVEEITLADIEEHGPTIYWSGTAKHNDYFRDYIRPGGLVETAYHFPAEYITPEQRVVMVSDLYHLPRLKRYAKKHEDKFPAERLVLYPAQPQRLPIKNTLGDLRNIYLYLKKGFIKE